MRCIFGIVLFLALYLGSCRLLGEFVAFRALRSGQAYSQRDAKIIGARAVTKYHALVAVGTGVTTIFVCSVPTLLMKMSSRSVPWQ